MFEETCLAGAAYLAAGCLRRHRRGPGEASPARPAWSSPVGPYARYGLPLVRACAEAGTHYADVTGEVLFVRDARRRPRDRGAHR